MKLQFSLAMLLVCVTVLAVVAAICSQVKVFIQDPFATTYSDFSGYWQPSWKTIAGRLIWSEPLALAATLVTLGAIRRLKSPRHTEPPVG